eukprot:NODE_6022_length_937_cov_37.781327_g5434_i0.p1 GENE.NODE_6022_length_937_cov_37.781327_g5434_i0~~NODE_6022_length_937_cov_37.781327_g5434_i0.p1  ORF type:complete len:243 (+),score=49.84 NODE_6022_length_937_cov_37.781327_g5434_i0:103-729(+)
MVAIGNSFMIIRTEGGPAGIELQCAEAHSSPITNMCWLPIDVRSKQNYEGHLLLTSSVDGVIKLWQTTNTKYSKNLQRSFTEEDMRSASTKKTKSPFRPTIKPKECLVEMIAHSGEVTQLLAIHNTCFISASTDGNVIAWSDYYRDRFIRTLHVRRLLIDQVVEYAEMSMMDEGLERFLPFSTLESCGMESKKIVNPIQTDNVPAECC